MAAKKWSARDSRRCIIVPSDLDHKYSRGVLGVITGSAQYPGAVTGAYIHNQAALAASKGGPINAPAIIAAIPGVIGKLV